MSELRQIGYIDNNVQGNRVYDIDGVGATLASQTGGLAGAGVGLYLIDEKESGKMTDINREVPKQKPFTYASLFSGIGGFEQALNKLGGTCVFASEFDKFAQQSYTALYGDEHLHGDITKIDEKDVPEHDLLVGGFPYN